MKRILLVFLSINFFQHLSAQTLEWSAFTDSTVTYSSPRAVDLTGDGKLDIVIGAGKEAAFTNFGVLAFDGNTGASLWTLPTRNEIFTSAQFQDVTGDNIPDVFVGGRNAQLYAINGSTGAVIWEFFPPVLGDPTLQGLYNFYTPQFIPDMSGDNIPDLLVANGGDHAAPVWQTNRPPGHLMIINAVNGAEISRVEVPDGAEIYCSPVVSDLKGTGTLYVVFGTGGETLPGSMWVAELNDVYNEDLSNAVALVTHPTLGFVAPASIAKFSSANHYDIVVQGYDGTIYRFNGDTYAQVWSVSFPGTESSAAPVIGNFTGTLAPDVFGTLYKGVAPSYSDFYQVMIDGATGNLVYKDSLLNMHFASPAAFDSNGDGRDEVLISGSNHVGHFRHQMKLIDFQNNTSADYWNSEAGSNIGCTPYVGDLNNDDLIDIVFAFRKDSLNPMGWKGTFVKRLSTGIPIPIKDIAWGSYMGTDYDGHYNFNFTNCGNGSIISNVVLGQPSCNGFSDGSIYPATGNGTPPFNFLWSDGSVGDKLLNVPAGSYSVIITDATGCSEGRNFVLADPFVISFGGINPVTCPGGTNGTATVSSTGCYCMFSGCNFLWETGTTGYTLSGVPSGMYSVTITHNNGCVVVDSIFIDEGAPIIDTSYTTQIDCYGADNGSVVLVPDQLITSYIWSNGESDSIANSLSPGIYTVDLTDNRNCTEQLTFEITEPDSLILNSSSTSISCFGSNDGEILLSASGGITDYEFHLDAASQANGTFSGLSAGSYSAFVTDSNNCQSAITTLTITEPSQLSITNQSTPETSLGTNDGTASATVAGGTAPYTYLWNDNAAQTTATATGLPTGTYQVTVTDGNGCTSTENIFVGHTTGLEELSAIFTVVAAPNPASDFITVEVSSAAGSLTKLEIIDLTGRVLLSENIQSSGTTRFDLNGFAAGNYFLKASSPTETKTIKLIVIN